MYDDCFTVMKLLLRKLMIAYDPKWHNIDVMVLPSYVAEALRVRYWLNIAHDLRKNGALQADNEYADQHAYPSIMIRTFNYLLLTY